MKDHYPTRHFQRYGTFDEITDSVTGSDGSQHVITMRGWHWNNLDWIVRNTTTTEQYIVDVSYMGTFGIVKADMSKSMEASIYFYIESYDNAIKGKNLKREEISRETRQ